MTAEEIRRIEALARSKSPLIVCDVDEVVLEFVAPFIRFLESREHEFRSDSFHLTGNIYVKNTGHPVEKKNISRFLNDFFAEHDGWQTPVSEARASLQSLEAEHGAEVVFLTAMPPRHHARRRGLLDAHGLTQPMIATEDAKGQALAVLLQTHPDRPVAFLDDLPANHLSILEAAPATLALHMMAYEPLRRHLPPLPDGVKSVKDWPQARTEISTFLANTAGLR